MSIYEGKEKREVVVAVVVMLVEVAVAEKRA